MGGGGWLKLAAMIGVELDKWLGRGSISLNGALIMNQWVLFCLNVRAKKWADSRVSHVTDRSTEGDRETFCKKISNNGEIFPKWGL